jgi:hypothetical protein
MHRRTDLTDLILRLYRCLLVTSTFSLLMRNTLYVQGYLSHMNLARYRLIFQYPYPDRQQNVGRN